MIHSDWIAAPCLGFGEWGIIGTRKWVMGVTCTPQSTVVAPAEKLGANVCENHYNYNYKVRKITLLS